MMKKHMKRGAVAFAYVAILFGAFLSLWILGSKIKTRTVPQGSIEVTTSYSKYLVGETVDFTVKNNFNSSVYIENNCPSEPLEVYRLESTKWVRIHDTTTSKNCAADDRRVEIEPNSTKSSDFSNWPRLFTTPGKYRIVVYVQYFNQLPYKDFEVLAKPVIPTIPALLPTPAPRFVQSNSPTGSQSTSGSTTAGGSASSSSPSQSTPKTFTLSQGTVTVTYTSSTIQNISTVGLNGYATEIDRGTTSGQVTFKKEGSEVQYNIRLRNGFVTITLAD